MPPGMLTQARGPNSAADADRHAFGLFSGELLIYCGGICAMKNLATRFDVAVALSRGGANIKQGDFMGGEVRSRQNNSKRIVSPVGRLVKALRLQMGMTQEELALRAGTTQTVITRLELGKTHSSQYLADILVELTAEASNTSQLPLNLSTEEIQSVLDNLRCTAGKLLASADALERLQGATPRRAPAVT